MKVDHVTFSSSGGAGIAARRIVEAQRLANIDAQLIFTTSGRLGSAGARKPSLLWKSIFDHCLIRKSTASSIVSVLRSTSSGKLKPREDALLHLHWVPGSVSLSEINAAAGRSSSLIITLHDMWALSGGCHFSNGCQKFKTGCKECPIVHRPFQGIISRHFEEKKAVYARFERVIVVSPGEQIVDAARQGSIFPPKTEYVHIPNPLPNSFSLEFGTNLEISNQSEFTIALVANDLSERRKNVEQAINTFERLVAKYSGTKKIKMVLIGRNPPVFSPDSAVSSLFFDNDQQKLISRLSTVNLLWSFSSDEVFPNAVVEAAAMGIPSVLSNIPTHDFASKAGFAVLFGNDQEAIEATFRVIDDRAHRRQLTESARSFARTLSVEAVGLKYRELYEDVLAQQNVENIAESQKQVLR